MTDLAFTPSGQLYGIGSVGGPNLYAINVSTGQATVVGSNGPLTSTTGGGLAIRPTPYNPSGAFYGTPDTTSFGIYNPRTGSFTDIANPAKPAGGGAYVALAFNDAGVLYGLNGGPGIMTPHLVTIDPGSAAVTDIGPSVNALGGIAFRTAPVPEPGGVLLACLGAGGAYAAWRRRRGTAHGLVG
jgi:hypothetical protein